MCIKYIGEYSCGHWAIPNYSKASEVFAAIPSGSAQLVCTDAGRECPLQELKLRSPLRLLCDACAPVKTEIQRMKEAESKWEGDGPGLGGDYVPRHEYLEAKRAAKHAERELMEAYTIAGGHDDWREDWIQKLEDKIETMGFAKSNAEYWQAKVKTYQDVVELIHWLATNMGSRNSFQYGPQTNQATPVSKHRTTSSQGLELRHTPGQPEYELWQRIVSIGTPEKGNTNKGIEERESKRPLNTDEVKAETHENLMKVILAEQKCAGTRWQQCEVCFRREMDDLMQMIGEICDHTESMKALQLQPLSGRHVPQIQSIGARNHLLSSTSGGISRNAEKPLEFIYWEPTRTLQLQHTTDKEGFRESQALRGEEPQVARDVTATESSKVNVEKPSEPAETPDLVMSGLLEDKVEIVDMEPEEEEALESPGQQACDFQPVKKRTNVTVTPDDQEMVPAEWKKGLIAQDLRQKREKEVRYLRHKLQQSLLTGDQVPKKEDMASSSEFLQKLERYPDLEVEIIRATKINKVLKKIIKLPNIPKDAVYTIRKRSTDLLNKWSVLLAAAESGSSTKGAAKDEIPIRKISTLHRAQQDSTRIQFLDSHKSLRSNSRNSMRPDSRQRGGGVFQRGEKKYTLVPPAHEQSPIPRQSLEEGREGQENLGRWLDSGHRSESRHSRLSISVDEEAAPSPEPSNNKRPATTIIDLTFHGDEDEEPGRMAEQNGQRKKMAVHPSGPWY